MLFLLTLLSLVSSQNNFYKATNIITSSSSISAILLYQGSPSPSVITSLNLTIISETYNRARIRITDLNNQRWEVPNIIIPSTPILLQQANYTITINESPFGLKIVRKLNNQTIFNIDPSQLFQYQNQDIILTTSLNYNLYIYGIGERIANFPLYPGIYTLFSKGLPGYYDNGKPPGKNIYSSHPVYLGIDPKGNSHGGFLLNSNAMDVTIASQSVTFRTIGGIIDYFVFVGPRPEDVVRQYQALIGFPGLVAY